MKTRLLAGLIATSFAASNAYATNGYFTHGYGTSHKGMAGAGVAVSEDILSAANNPAALSVEGSAFSLGVEFFAPTREYRASAVEDYELPGFYLKQQVKKSDNSLFAIPEFAFATRVNNEINLGVLVYANGGMNTKYSVRGEEPGAFYAGTAGVDLKQLFISPTLSYRLSEATMLGFAPVFVVQQFDATGLASFAPYSAHPHLLSDTGTSTSTGLGFQLGIQHQAGEKVRFGASYRSSVSMDKFEKYRGLFAGQGGFDLPASIQLGVAWNVTPTHQLLLDWQKISYSEVSSIANPMSNMMTAQLGADNGAGFGWQDMDVFKLGYQWLRSESQKLRAGISYGEQPIPGSEVLFNILAPAVQEWHYTAGITQRLTRDMTVNMMAFYSPKKTVMGANPLALGQDISLAMKQTGFAASATWYF